MIRLRKIRPAEEEIGNIFPVLLFVILWYGAIGVTISRAGFQVYLLLFLAAGLLPLGQTVTSIRRALFYRKQRADAIALGHEAEGRIISVTQQNVPYVSGKRGYVRYRRYYCLNVEMYDSATGMPTAFQSQGYRIPVHLYLCSDRISVYTDQSGWKHYLENFQLKQHRSDPGPFAPSNDFDETHPGTQRFTQIVAVIILIFMLLNIFLQF